MSEPRSKACAAFGDQLTAYLDGELEGDRVSAVRGHLRECEGCRVAAHDLAALRDGLRALAPLDPPPSLWAGVQAELAAQEVADAHRPGWRRMLARWTPMLPRFGGFAFAAAVAATLLWWRTGHHVDSVGPGTSGSAIAIATPVEHPTPTPPPPPATAVCPAAGHAADTLAITTPDDETADVAVALAAEPARTTARYTAAVDELLGLACDARGEWTDAHRTTFDTAVTKLRTDIASATPGRSREHAWRALVRYLQDTVVHDEVASIDVNGERGTFAGSRGTP